MKNLKVKTLTLLTLSTLFLTSTPAMAINTGMQQPTTGFDILHPTIPHHLDPDAPQASYVRSYKILGYSDDLHYDSNNAYLSNLFPTNNREDSVYDVFCWASDDNAYVYLGTYQDSLGANRAYASVDNEQWNYNNYVCKDVPFPASEGLDLLGFTVPQGRHTVKLVLSAGNRFSLPGKSDEITRSASINLRVSKLSAYVLNQPLANNNALTWTFAKPLDPNNHLADYVGIFDKDTGNQVITSLNLSSDNQTIVIDSLSGQFPQNSSGYQLVINPGLKFTDNTESCEGTMVDFTTFDQSKSTTSSAAMYSTSLLQTKKKIVNKINIKADDPLATYGMEKDTNNEESKLKNFYKYRSLMK